MPLIQPEDLPADIQAILNTPAREGACINEQPVCYPDHRVTAQLTNEPAPDSMVRPWRIVNAHKGDLFLSPGGPSGLIGGLLMQLDDPQFYSHIGIMVEDQVAVRHATSSPDRLTHEQFTTGNLFGYAAPTDGYNEDALRFQWPGTLTQSIEQAYITWRYHPKELDEEGKPRRYSSADEREIPHKDFSYHDPVTNERYPIDAFSFKPVIVETKDAGWKEVWPLVIKPCPHLETTAIRRALERVADVSKEIRGHYRLFCYTRGDIAGDHLGPPMLEDQQRDPDSGCTGASPALVPVTKTLPFVCSTFIWWAVQEANRVGAPKIILDGRPLRGRRNEQPDFDCMSHTLLGMTPRPNDARVDAEFDGLYHYSEKERRDAATWLHDDYTVPLVQNKLDKALPFIYRAVGAGSSLTLAGLFSALKLFPVAGVANLLGVSTLFLNDLIAALTDMPDDVANQLVNSFAFDSGGPDSEDWRHPDSGITVSPDDILNEWAPPQEQSWEEIHGVYGWNTKMDLQPPEFVRNPPPPSTWQISQGTAEYVGRVFLRDSQGTPVGVQGAHVRIGCEKFVTDENGVYATEPVAPTGLYWGIASYTDPTTGLHCEAEGRRIYVGIPGGDNSDFDFELRLPPDTRRKVWVKGRMDLTNRHIIGKDWHGHPEFIDGCAYLDVDFFFFPDRPEYQVQREASQTGYLYGGSQIEDWGRAEIVFNLAIQPDKSVVVTYRARLKQEEDDPWQESGVMTVPPKSNNNEPGVKGPSVDMMRMPFSPVRAHIEFEIHNDRL